MSLTLRPLAGPVTGRAAAPVLFLLGLLLSGCGVAGTGFHPGVAAQVGDATILVGTVDQMASDYCTAIEGQLANQSLPQRYLRGGIAGQLTLASAARQLAGDYDVQPGRQYDQKVAELQGAVGTLSEGEQDAVIEIESSATYISGVQQAIGDKLLLAKGTANPTIDAATAEGQRVFNAWLTEHDVTIDPQFGIAIKDGQAVPTDTSISVAVGTTAKNGQADTPDPAYAAALPDSHRCG